MDVDGDIWTEFQPLVKQLYEVNRKTLRDVKTILEGQHGFPETPLHVYEAKLRDQYGLRKRLKAGDWSLIHNYALANGFGEYDVFLNGNLIPLAKVRKELSRRHVLKSKKAVDMSNATLPQGVEVRSRGASVLAKATTRNGTPPATGLASRDSTSTFAPVSAPGPLATFPPENTLHMETGVRNTTDVNVSTGQDREFPLALASPAPQGSDSMQLDLGAEELSSVSTSLAVGSKAMPSSASRLDISVTDADEGNDAELLTSIFLDSPNWNVPSSTDGTATTANLFVNPQALVIQTRAEDQTLVSPEFLSQFFKLRLESIPWNQFKLSLQGDHAESNPGSGLTPILDTHFPTLYTVQHSTSSSQALGTNFDTLHFLSQVVYVFSNNLHRRYNNSHNSGYVYPNDSDYDSDDEIADSRDDHIISLLNSLARGIRYDIVVSIFNSSSTSIKATWENLFDLALSWKLKNGLLFLIRLALQMHHEWIHEYNNPMLIAALSIDEITLIRGLLDKGANPAIFDPRSGQTGLAIAAACEATACARLLVEACNPNRVAVYVSGSTGELIPTSLSLFELFAMETRQEFTRLGHRHDSHSLRKLAAYLEILDYLLAAGADVDAEIEFNRLASASCGWKLTCLDLCYYSHRSMFDRALPHSQHWSRRLTRARLCEAFIHGMELPAPCFQAAATSEAKELNDYLEGILTDQFQITVAQPKPKRPRGHSPRIMTATQAAIARALIQREVCLRLVRDGLEEPEILLRMIVQSALERGLHEDLEFLLKHLARETALVSSRIFKICIKHTGTDILDALLQCDADFDDLSEALLLAAEKYNYEAVTLLLAAGVDVNSQVWTEEHAYSKPSTVLWHLMRGNEDRRKPGHHEDRQKPEHHEDRRKPGHHDDLQDRREMWKFLVERGAKLRLHRANATCFPLLARLVQVSNGMPVQLNWEAFNFVVQNENMDLIPPSKWAHQLRLSIEKGANWKIMHFLYQRVGHIAEPILATVIRLGGNAQFVDELLVAGQDINDFSGNLTPLQAAAQRLDPNLVLRLLQLGARVNTCSREATSRTALQTVCAQEAETPGEMDRQWRLVRLLIEHSADLSPPANDSRASTPLQLICRQSRHSEEKAHHIHQMFRLLLDCGADVNAEPGPEAGTALQNCAAQGDLEKVVMLFQHGADPNAFPQLSRWTPWDNKGSRRGDWCSALDLAARAGRLDMTHFLLGVGALSANPGATGYQGAIDLARDTGQNTVADVIEHHVKQLVGLHNDNPHMLIAGKRLIEQHSFSVQRRIDAHLRKRPRSEYTR